MVDRYRQKCLKCSEGTYIEKTLSDSWEGILTCDKCGDYRYRYEEDEMKKNEPIKIDIRIETEYTDAELKEFGWAPGGYLFNCGRCGRTGEGDKRCPNCFNCAVNRKYTYESNGQIPEVRELRAEVKKLKEQLSAIREVVNECYKLGVT